MRTVGVIQARMGSSRLAGKSLALIGGRPLVLWAVGAVERIRGLDDLVIAVTDEPRDDELVELLIANGLRVHRGPVFDVLTRCWEAVAPAAPGIVIRETADNPFIDPAVVGAQVARLVDGGFDYVGTTGWPMGIAGEVARADALETAYREAREPAEREHVMPFLYARPDRFMIGTLPPPTPLPAGRFTVDTAEDLAFARAIAERLGAATTTSIGELGRIVAEEPGLLEINRAVRQRPWQETER
jgi:spore coat polysaccharide biosynthesis protein SpsF